MVPKLRARKNEDRFKEEAECKGLSLIGNGKTCDYRLYKFKACGHEKEIQIANVRRCKGVFKCSACVEDRINLVAEQNNLTVIRRIDKSYFEYRFNDCGHKQAMQYSHVERGNFQCKKCIREREDHLASNVGLRIISHGRNSDYRVVLFKSCGHTQEIKMGEIKTNRFQCKQCNDYFWTRPSNVYVAEISSSDGFKWIKFGYARVIENRSNLYGLSDNCEFNLVASVSMKTGEMASLEEKAVHAKYKEKRLSKSMMKKYHTKSGFTECYPVAELPNLIAEIERIRCKAQ